MIGTGELKQGGQMTIIPIRIQCHKCKKLVSDLKDTQKEYIPRCPNCGILWDGEWS